MDPPPTVCVIGGGPAAMFFCHAVETKRRELAEKGDEAGLTTLPEVSCFERDASPGGVWRANRAFEPVDDYNHFDEKKMPDEQPPSPPSSVNMYEALFTNGPKECIEFFDYTFDEHFGCQLPVYMPREPMLQYMMARVTKYCPNFFEKYMTFNTSVVSVKFDQTTSKFIVETCNMLTHELITHYYDKCIWGAGVNGSQKMPASIVNMLHEGGFYGRVIHSSDTANFEQDVRGKRVLLIGGSFSAEDLAYMAIKVGAKKVYVSSRDTTSPITWTAAWPFNKVETLLGQVPFRVTEGGRCIQFSGGGWSFPGDFLQSGEVETELRNIDTVIFCTGYEPNYKMLDEELRRPAMPDKQATLDVPVDWTMGQNKLTKKLGEVKPKDVRWVNSLVMYPELYNGIVLSNPSMMFLMCEEYDNPLTAIDVNAWVLLSYITGARKLPSKAEMRKRNEEAALDQMRNPYIRSNMDRAYAKAIGKVSNYSRIEAVLQEYELDAQGTLWSRILARCMQESNYPVSFGTYEELNEKGKLLAKYCIMSVDHRRNLKRKLIKDSQWRTFRDYKDGSDFKSIYTGTEAAEMKQRWLDVDANDPSFFKH